MKGISAELCKIELQYSQNKHRRWCGHCCRAWPPSYDHHYMICYSEPPVSMNVRTQIGCLSHFPRRTRNRSSQTSLFISKTPLSVLRSCAHSLLFINDDHLLLGHSFLHEVSLQLIHIRYNKQSAASLQIHTHTLSRSESPQYTTTTLTLRPPEHEQ
ncbi:hypothetical protein BC835DRAFT_1319036 [Cytidiella melzeri]|nr:hypothetical protein BC835DRAFT_1319036 [Cytidiella melzeri]